MNILFLVDIVPYPPNTGHKIRTFNIIKQLSLKHRIYLLAFNHKIMINDTTEKIRCKNELLKHCEEVYIFEIPSDKNQATYYTFLIKNIFEIHPYRVKRYYSKEFLNTLLEIISRVQFDIVHLDKTEFFNYSKFFKRTPVVATNHNVESELMRERFYREINMFRKIFAFLQFVKMRKYERYALNKVNAFITCTDLDYEFFKKKIGIQNRHATIENGVDVQYYHPIGINEGDFLLIIGAQNKESTANFDATLYFMKEIWPIIMSKNSLINLKIVGRNPDKSIVEFEKHFNNVQICGFLEDERDVLERCLALVVPLRIGGGSRLKILTAMAMRKTIVSTSKGAEGIRYEAGKNILIADTPSCFASEILRAVENPDLRKKIGVEAQNLVLKYYDWKVIGNKLLSFYESIIVDG